MACACLAVLVTSVWCWGQVGDRPTTAVAQRKTLLRLTGIPTRSRQTTVHLQPLLTKTRQTCPSPQGQVSGRTSLVHQLLTPVFDFPYFFRSCGSAVHTVVRYPTFTVHLLALTFVDWDQPLVLIAPQVSPKPLLNPQTLKSGHSSDKHSYTVYLPFFTQVC